ncbi:ThuA domain-containing protein [Agromyces salentinus]|uniref:ThuA-like domain-containing protein n=1 Tax=Agromyces salentinus TaxID=269421 RepID=A0ABN2MGQ7_9MICO|nr:ThuA domain-containing protein [Agromyces salentinus]
MTDVVILSGGGRYADPWHPFAETSAALADLAREAGYEVDVRDDPDAALAALDPGVRVLVVNAGDPGDRPPADERVVAAAEAALDAASERGVGILAMHAAAASLRDYAAFERALGGRWVPDVSWHPPIGRAHVHVVGNHAIAEGLTDFTVVDERYTRLQLLATIEPIAEHEEDGTRHPLVWAREVGHSRLVYDALGHDVRSYESPEHRALLTRALAWLAAVPGPSADDRV